MNADKLHGSDDGANERALHRIQSFGFTIVFLMDKMVISDRKGQSIEVSYNRAQVLQARPMATDANAKLRPAAEAEPLRAQLSQAADRLRSVTLERDQWKTRAVAAETQLQARAAGNQGAGSRYQKLKAFLAREFHPDNPAVAGLEKLIRTELFKSLWPKIQEIDEIR